MQPWSPDDLLAEAAAVAGAVTADPAAAFDPLGGVLVESSNREFVEDHPSDGLTGFLARLEPEEREALYQLVESELRERVRAELEAENARWRQEREAMLQQLADELRRHTDTVLEEVARRCVELAIAMAEQVVRCRLEVDRESLLRALETIVYRAPRGTKFTLLANPEDIAFLREHAAALEALGIEEIHPDRRITPGGCTITAGGQEWDYTVEGRLERIASVVREALLSETEGEEDR